MAEALLNHLAREQGLDFHAESAGTVMGSRVNPMAVEATAELGIDLSTHSPKQLTQEMADRADLIITMGCGVDASACPARILISEDWGLDDPAGQPIEKVREVRDQIEARVRDLLTRTGRS